jgi:deoxyribonuclease-4
LRLGFHVRTSGGLVRAASRAIELGCETVQIFSGNPRGWRRPAVDAAQASRFRALLAAADIRPVFVHVPYLANPAAEDEALWRRSLELIAHDLGRSVELGGDWLILHCGSSRAAPERAEERIAAAVSFGLERVPEGRLALENTAGQGAQVCHGLEQVARILARIGEPERTGACLDVAHAFEAGYDVGTPAGMDEVISLLGRERLKLIHLSDSKSGRGSRVDRHWHLGEGRIGEAGIRSVLTHPGLAHLPAVMETPKDSPEADERNMAVARKLSGGAGH